MSSNLEGAPPTLLNDLQPVPYGEARKHRPFTTRDSINEFRDIMLKKAAHDRFVGVTKVVRNASSSMVKKPDEEFLLGGPRPQRWSYTSGASALLASTTCPLARTHRSGTGVGS
jgi:hypothetical protein